MSELISARDWLYDTLSGDATLSAAVDGVYADIIPDGVSYPVVLITEYTPGTDTAFNNATRILVNPTFIVRAVGATPSISGLETVADRIDTLLHKKSSSTDGVLSCVREQPFSLAEFDAAENKHYRHLGGVYRLLMQ